MRRPGTVAARRKNGRVRVTLLFLMLVLLAGRRSPGFAQAVPAAPRPPDAFGYRRLVVMFGRDSVQVLLLSKKRGGAAQEAAAALGAGLAAGAAGAL